MCFRQGQGALHSHAQRKAFVHLAASCWRSITNVDFFLSFVPCCARVQVGTELTPTHPGHFAYKHIPVLDLEEEDLVKYFDQCFQFIDAGRDAGAQGSGSAKGCGP